MRYKNIETSSKGEIVIYQTKDKKVELEVKLDRETLWLSQKQIADLFRTDRTVITKHLLNIFNCKELDESSVSANFAHTAKDGKVYQVKFYNLDAIISVGYRVNSDRATQFRIWATQILKKHLVEGYTLNERRLREQNQKLKVLQKAVELIQTVRSRKELEYQEITGLLDVIGDYSYALELLDNYDHGKLAISRTLREEKFRLTYEEAVKIVRQLRKKFGTSDLFGREKDDSFKSSITSIYQTFDRKELYPSVEEKAANLLYFIVKNHSFVDGNKRIAASLFLWFLKQNSLLYRENGTKRIADNALVALTLMIAESDPRERQTIVTLVVNLINRNN